MYESNQKQENPIRPLLILLLSKLILNSCFLDKTPGAYIHSKEQLNYETRVEVISHSENVPKSNRQATSPELVNLCKYVIRKEQDSPYRNHTLILDKRRLD